jgi:hypothetical protein
LACDPHVRHFFTFLVEGFGCLGVRTSADPRRASPAERGGDRLASFACHALWLIHAFNIA